MKFRKVSLICGAFLAFGCTGAVDAPEPQRASNGGATGSGGSGGVAPGESGPGRVTLRRLNGREYDNTIRDLVGLDLKPSLAVEFPADEWGDGFDNDGDVLTTSPLAVEK